MLTVCIALLTLAGCAAVRRYLEQGNRQKNECCGDSVRLEMLWNEGAAFGLKIPVKAVMAVSAVLLAVVWKRRREAPVGAGLILGGGISNLLERLLKGRVLDYVRFPKAPGRLKRYVFNLADFAVLFGCIGLLLRKKQ